MPRNGSGTYALPSGNPVVDNTVIETTWANPTMADIATQLNGVVTRDMLLGPTVPVLGQDGTVSLPGYTFASQQSTGMYRTSGLLGFSYAGTLRMSISSAGDVAFQTAGAAVTNVASLAGIAAGAAVTNIVALNSGQLAGLRNRLINGGFTVAQRGTTGAAPTLGYLADRWYSTSTGVAPTYTVGTGSFTGYEKPGVLTITGIASNTTISVWQRIESINCADMAGKTIAMSYWCYQSTGGAVTCTTSLYYANVADTFSSNTLISTSAGTSVPDSTWTRVTATFSVPAAAVTGLVVGMWANGNAILAGKQLSFANAQLELGSVATIFEQRPYPLELALCLRYCYAYRGYNFAGYNTAASGNIQTVSFPVVMRAAPSVTKVGSHTFSNCTEGNTNGNAVSISAFELYCVNTGTGGFQMTASSSEGFTYSAEL